MRRIGIVVLGLGLTAVPGLRADTLNVAGDAQTSSTQPNTKFGLFPIMTVRNAPTGAILNSYAKFDLSALPDAPTVDKTVLRLWVNLVTTPGTIEVLPILESWQEGTITANSSPDLGSPITSFAVASGDCFHFIDVDITALVQDWASGYLANNGLALRGVSPGSVNVIFDTKESILTKLRASDGETLGTFPVGDFPQGVAVDGANIWVANADSDDVTKLRASDGANLGTFPVGDFPQGVAFDGANIWVANAGTVTKY